MKKRTSNVSRRIVSLLMSMVLTLTLVTPAAFAEGMGAYANGRAWTALTWLIVVVVAILTVVMFVLQALGY